jgi:hypothetical protein
VRTNFLHCIARGQVTGLRFGDTVKKCLIANFQNPDLLILLTFVDFR